MLWWWTAASWRMEEPNINGAQLQQWNFSEGRTKRMRGKGARSKLGGNLEGALRELWWRFRFLVTLLTRPEAIKLPGLNKGAVAAPGVDGKTQYLLKRVFSKKTNR